MKFLAWHLGLGDAIACADLAVRLADGEQMFVPCYAHNEVSVRSIFVNHPNIGICDPLDPVIVKFGIERKDIIDLGSYSGIPRKEGEDMVEWMYRTAGMDPATRFDSQMVAKAAHGYGTYFVTGHAILVHQDNDRGFVTDRKYIPVGNVVGVNSAAGKSILAWWKSIETAAEIHCIDSSVLHLVEQLQPTGKLFYHKYATTGR